MSEWIEPKTDWQPTDYINVEDWQRIYGNLLYLKQLAKKMYPHIPWIDTSAVKEYNDWPYADEWNAVEEDLEMLYTYTYPSGSGKLVTFYGNGPMVDYIELNRIESSMSSFYDSLTSQNECLKVLAFTLGGDDIRV